MVVSLSDGELYSGTAYNFLGSEPIISRYSPSQSLLRTEYSTSWLNGGFSGSFLYNVSPRSSSFRDVFSAFLAEPSFVFADVIRESADQGDGEDDKIYYFFTEVSVEYEFFSKLLIPRVARVCKVSVRHIAAAFSFKPLVLAFCSFINLCPLSLLLLSFTKNTSSKLPCNVVPPFFP